MTTSKRRKKHQNLKECHEEAAGYSLSGSFFAISKIDPEADCQCEDFKNDKR